MVNHDCAWAPSSSASQYDRLDWSAYAFDDGCRRGSGKPVLRRACASVKGIPSGPVPDVAAEMVGLDLHDGSPVDVWDAASRSIRYGPIYVRDHDGIAGIHSRLTGNHRLTRTTPALGRAGA